MANVFLNIPVPAANGVGAPVDVSSMGRTKTFVCGGGFVATVNVEFSTDVGGVIWAPLATFLQNGNLTTDVAAKWFRAVTSDYKSGTPNLDVGASDSGTTFAILLGDGTPVDVSAMPLLKTVVAQGSANIEVSGDGNDWAQVFSFQTPGGITREVVAQFARVQPGGPTVTLAAAADNSGGGGGGSFADQVTIVGAGTMGDPFVTQQLIAPGPKEIRTDFSGIRIDVSAVPGDPINLITLGGGISLGVGFGVGFDVVTPDTINTQSLAGNLGFYDGFGASTFQTINVGGATYADVVLTQCFVNVNTTGGGASIGGFNPSTGFPLHAIVNLFNIGPDALTLLDEHLASTSFFRFKLIGAAPVVIPAFGGVQLQRFIFGAETRWGVIARSV